MLDYLDDLDADFLAIYRIDDISTLSGPRFLSLAMRVSAYQGVMAARVAAQENDDSGEKVREVQSSRTAVTADPVLGGIVSWGDS